MGRFARWKRELVPSLVATHVLAVFKDVEVRQRVEPFFLNPAVKIINDPKRHVGTRLRPFSIVQPDLARLDRRQELSSVRKEPAAQVPIQRVAPSLKHASLRGVMVSIRTGLGLGLGLTSSPSMKHT